MTRAASPLALALAGLLAGTALAGCSGGGGDEGGPVPVTTPAATGSSGAAGYPSVAAGIDLTPPGTTVQLGQSATVAWRPSQHLVGALQITVTAMRSTSFAQSFHGWQLDEATTSHAPYFVTATVRNAGQTDLSGQQVPLYGAAASGALVEASRFASDFKPCSPGVLPTPFAPGATTDVCLVYLVPDTGTLVGVTFRPTESFQPITWKGPLTTLQPSPTRTPSAATSPKRSPKATARATASPAR